MFQRREDYRAHSGVASRKTMLRWRFLAVAAGIWPDPGRAVTKAALNADKHTFKLTHVKVQAGIRG